jgi:hypothetical protein
MLEDNWAARPLEVILCQAFEALTVRILRKRMYTQRLLDYLAN